MENDPGAIALALSEIAADLLDADVLVDDNFFQIGGYSLLVVKLVAGARKAGIELSAALVFEHQVFTAIAAALVDRDEAPPTAVAESFDDLWRGAVGPWDQPRPSTVVPLVTGAQTPFFCVHWGSGNIDFLGRFARQAGFTRPLYGVRSAMLERRERPLLTVGDLAERYLADIRAVQPRGPYLLGGLCSGGQIAFEMAHRLTERGEEVAGVVLVNSTPPTVPHGFDLGWGLGEFYRFRLAWLGRKFGVEDLSAAAGRIMPEVTALDWYEQGTTVEEWYWLQLIWSSLVFAQLHYEPRPYDGPVTVLQQDEYAADSRTAWSPFATDLVTHQFAHPDTYAIVQDPRFWTTLGQTLDTAEGR